MSRTGWIVTIIIVVFIALVVFAASGVSSNVCPCGT